MAEDDQTLTAADLEALSPNERHRLLAERLAFSSEVSAEFLARVKRKGRALLEDRKALPHTDE